MSLGGSSSTREDADGGSGDKAEGCEEFGGIEAKVGDTNHKVCLPDLYICSAMTGDDSDSPAIISTLVLFNHL